MLKIGDIVTINLEQLEKINFEDLDKSQIDYINSKPKEIYEVINIDDSNYPYELKSLEGISKLDEVSFAENELNKVEVVDK